MDFSTLLSVVHTLLASFDALNCSELKQVWSMWNDESTLEKLKAVADTIKNVLLDAEDKYIFDQLPRVTQQYIEELSSALYDADDLIDEFVTLAQQKHLSLLREDEFNKEVGLFFSCNDPLSVTRLMSKWVEKIESKLDSVKATPGKLDLLQAKRGETCSFTDTVIIGRDDDVKEIVDKLLHSNVPALTIVGTGKTALVQLVLKHDKIKIEFPLRLWVCVSDHNQKKLDVKTILAQILKSAGEKSKKLDGCSMNALVKQVRELLLGKRFLLVLDDLWTESRHELQKLLGHLDGGKLGRIVVTTRSEKTANIMGESVKYLLQRLSKEYSWELFLLTAFDKKDRESQTGSYIDKYIIGKDIIKKCGDVPLAIIVIGSLLYREDISKWREVRKFELANLSEDENLITPILKLSYHNLESPLRSCFSYCSLYPKDFRINKEDLIRLWIAQGYVVPLVKGQSVEDVGEEYFSVLLRRCFFQDVKKDGRGQIISFKLHDLMHDVALEVSNKEICPASSFPKDMVKAARHVSLTNEQYANFDLINAHVRTIIGIECYRRDNAHGMVLRLENYRRLRTLDLSWLGIEILPDSIGKLIHLRHLDLFCNDMEVLPNSITELYNLQTLDLSYCDRLKELPKNFSNLINLRDLRLRDCEYLTLKPYIITWMSKLINLELYKFEVDLIDSSLKQRLEGLKALKMLRELTIAIDMPSSDRLATEDNTITDGGYLRDMEHLDSIVFEFRQDERSEEGSDYEEELFEFKQDERSEGGSDYEEELFEFKQDERSEGGSDYKEELFEFRQDERSEGRSDYEEESFEFKQEERNEGGSDYQEELLGALQPHKNLKDLWLKGYLGEKMPRSWAIEVNLTDSLPKLVKLVLWECYELKCLPTSFGYLQNLKKLRLFHLPKLEYMETPHEIVLKHGEASGECLQFFPCLLELTLEYLPEFKGWVSSGEIGVTTIIQPSSLIFSKLIDLTIFDCLNLTSLPGCPNVKELTIYDSLVPLESLQYLTKLTIFRDWDVENLVDYGRAFRACSSSLRTLEISQCKKLRSVSGGLVYLNALESLTLRHLPIMNLEDEDEEIEGDVECDGMPWGALSHTLQYLEIRRCPEVKTFPKWMRKLTSLQQLYVDECSKELYERCQNPNGVDWPNIQHISCIVICNSLEFTIQQNLNLPANHSS